MVDVRAMVEGPRSLPGDDLIPEAGVVMDRRATLNAPLERVWPWLLQLGKGRAGWYLSRRLERVVPRANRALREIDPRFQEVAVGDRVADYGRDGWFEARVVDPPHTLVWWSERGQDLHLTWALVIEASGPEPASFTSGCGSTAASAGGRRRSSSGGPGGSIASRSRS